MHTRLHHSQSFVRKVQDQSLRVSLSGEKREIDKPRQGVAASTLKLSRNGAVGFIVWLDLFRAQVFLPIGRQDALQSIRVRRVRNEGRRIAGSFCDHLLDRA
jgi:hypothetical protein